MVTVSTDDFLAHYGVKGMKWGVRKASGGYREEAFNRSAGASKTHVIAKNGDQLTITKRKLGGMAVAISRVTGQDPAKAVSCMEVTNSDGKKVGSFQIWREGTSTVRGEWLEIKKSEQGKGYSEASIRGLMKAADKDPNLKEVRLQVPSAADAAKHIYTKLGFEKDVDLGDTAMFGNIEDWVYRTNKTGR